MSMGGVMEKDEVTSKSFHLCAVNENYLYSVL